MTKYFCDKCKREIAREIDIQCVTFKLEYAGVYDVQKSLEADKELCLECLSKAIQDFKNLINM